MTNCVSFFIFSKTPLLITFTSDLNYYDDKIELTDASNLYNPVANRNIAGVVEIDGERIELKAEELQEQRLFIRACMNQTRCRRKDGRYQSRLPIHFRSTQVDLIRSANHI